jgi:hypothetical protein
MPKKRRSGWVDWVKTDARAILLEDLNLCAALRNPDSVTVEQAWEVYKDLPEFEKIQYSQFKQRFVDHRSRASHRYQQSILEAAALKRDRKINPTATHNNHGEVDFRLSPAKDLLRSDVQQGRHIGLTPSEFQRTRPEYMVFPAGKFKDRIYQAVRRMKFINYLEFKRMK